LETALEDLLMIETASVRRGFALIGRLVLVLLLSACFTGCGGPGTGNVSGQVLFQGKPLPGGIVMFRPVNTSFNPVTAPIDQDGKYEVRVPAGECKISVDNHGLQHAPTGPVGVSGAPENVGGRRGGPPKGAVGPPKGGIGEVAKEKGAPEISIENPVGTYVPIPKDYYDPETSGLTLTVKTGSQTHNIELTKK
jgi:hypothetical protein